MTDPAGAGILMLTILFGGIFDGIHMEHHRIIAAPCMDPENGYKDVYHLVILHSHGKWPIYR